MPFTTLHVSLGELEPARRNGIDTPVLRYLGLRSFDAESVAGMTDVHFLGFFKAVEGGVCPGRHPGIRFACDLAFWCAPIVRQTSRFLLICMERGRISNAHL